MRRGRIVKPEEIGETIFVISQRKDAAEDIVEIPVEELTIRQGLAFENDNKIRAGFYLSLYCRGQWFPTREEAEKFLVKDLIAWRQGLKRDLKSLQEDLKRCEEKIASYTT